jgi:hypothetical protein
MSTAKSAEQLWRGRAVSKLLSATRLLFEGSAGTNAEARMRTGFRKVALWLISFAALISLPAGMFCLVASGTTRTTDPDQVGLATEGVSSQAAVTFGQAIQALSVRH